MTKPLLSIKKVKKHKHAFNRYHSDRYMRVKKSWRKPHGIDNRMRRKFRGSGQMPGVGFGSAKITRDVHPNGFKKFLVRNEKELEVLLMHNHVYCAELAHNLSGQTRKKIVERAAALDIKVTNPNARVRTEEKK